VSGNKKDGDWAGEKTTPRMKPETEATEQSVHMSKMMALNNALSA